VKSIKAFKSGLSADAATQAAGIVSVTAKGTDTVLIKLSYADPAFTMYLGKGLGYVASAASDPNDKSNPIGSGPYIYDKASSVAGSSYVFKPNPTYWNKANRKFDNLVVKYMPNAAAAVNAIKAGQVDLIAIQDNTAIAGLRASGFNIAVQQLNWRGINFIDKAGRMGTPLKNLKVRQAINYAIDRKAMLDLVQLGAGDVTQQVFAKYNVGYVAALENTYTYNVDKAKSLLAEAGYPNGFSIDMPQNNALPAVAFNFLSDQLSKVGITVKWTGYAGADWAAAVLAPKFPMSHGGLERSTNDWALVRFLIARDAAWNPSGFGDATSDRLIANMQAAKTATAYKAAAQAINKYVVAQAWYAPLYTQDVYVAYSSAVKVTAHAGNAAPFLTDITPR
jgi:peptide/nickel transport system substrate-binding protein